MAKRSKHGIDEPMSDILSLWRNNNHDNNSSGQPAVPTTQIPGVYRRRIGDIVVTAISDGSVNGSYDFTRNIAPQDPSAF